MGRSKPVPSFRRSAGARFTVTRRSGNSNPALRIAARTRSRASWTAVSGSPDDREVREPVGDVDLDRDERRLEAPEGAAQRPCDRAHGRMLPSRRATER